MIRATPASESAVRQRTDTLAPVTQPSIDPHRLPRWLTPTHYDIAMSVDPSHDGFDGQVTVSLDVSEPTSLLICNLVGLNVASITTPGATITGWDVVAETERLHIHLDADLEVGPTTLTVVYSGVWDDQLVGLYRSVYRDDDGNEHRLAVTQFEAPHARRAFPCWDEPDRKATFSVTLDVPSDMLAVSNGLEMERQPLGDGTDRVRFADTMAMSTYLVAWVVGDLVATEPVDVNGTPVRIISRPGTQNHCQTALDVAVHSVRWFEEYYGIAYPGDSLDLVAVPDFAFGAMENLGCVTFREILLIVDPDAVTQAELERAATVIAHEIAHMWFGDLVTMDWWTGIWLNEAFATFMEMACVDAYAPDWGVWTTFGLSRAEAFHTDSLASTRAIEYEVQTPEDAEGMFDILTYEKGAAVLRMMEQFLGPEVFRDGVRRYLTTHAYGNTVTSDLWDALEETSGVPVRRVMDSWILQGGHPVITVSASRAHLTISQSRMSYAGATPVEDRSWVIPVSLRSGDSTERVLLDGERQELDRDPSAIPVQANAGSVGFYRTAYEPDLHQALVSSATDLSAVEQFTLLDDTWALVLADRLDIGSVLEAMRSLAGTEHVPVWRRIAGIVSDLSRMTFDRPEIIQSLAAELTSGRLDDPGLLPEHAAVIWTVAGAVGDNPRVIEESRTRADDSSIDPELRAAALVVAATHGDHRFFAELVDRFHAPNSPQEERRLLNAFTRFRSNSAFQEFLEMCRTEIRIQDAPYQLALAMGNPQLGAGAWTFVSSNWDSLVERFPSNSIVRMASGITSLYRPEIATAVDTFFDGHPIPQGAITLAQHREMLAVHTALTVRVRRSLGAVATDPLASDPPA